MEEERQAAGGTAARADANAGTHAGKSTAGEAPAGTEPGTQRSEGNAGESTGRGTRKSAGEDHGEERREGRQQEPGGPRKRSCRMDDWFTIVRVEPDTYIIREYRHREETHCYLLNGSARSLLIDTGLGIGNIYDEVVKRTDKPVTAVATHVHWDHIGGHRDFPGF